MKVEVAGLDSPPNSPYGLCGHKATANLNNNIAKLGCCAAKVEVAVLGSVSLMLVIVAVAVDVYQQRRRRRKKTTIAPSSVTRWGGGVGVTMACQVQFRRRVDPRRFCANVPLQCKGTRTDRFRRKHELRGGQT